MSNANFVVTSNAASSPTVLPAPDVRTGLPHQGRFHTAKLNRQRQSLEREPRAISAVLHSLLRVIEAHLRQGSGASAQDRFGAVSFIHRSGASLNHHVHDDENHRDSRAARALAGAQIRSRRIGHCCVIDGVFGPVEEADDVPQSVRFRPAAELPPRPSLPSPSRYACGCCGGLPAAG
jgi:hypothetical protein